MVANVTTTISSRVGSFIVVLFLKIRRCRSETNKYSVKSLCFSYSKQHAETPTRFESLIYDQVVGRSVMRSHLLNTFIHPHDGQRRERVKAYPSLSLSLSLCVCIDSCYANYRAQTVLEHRCAQLHPLIDIPFKRSCYNAVRKRERV